MGLTWWVGDVGGVLVTTPPLLLWAQHARLPSRAAMAVTLAALLGVGALVYARGSPLQGYPVAHLFLPVVIAAALWLGPWGAVLSILLTSAISTWSTAHGLGPYAVFPKEAALVLVQAAVFFTAVATLVLAASLNERRRAEAALARARDELEERVAERTAQLRRVNEESIRARDDFLCIASHELKTPLAALLLQVQALERIALRGDSAPPGSASDRFAASCAIAARQVRRLDGLVDDLLDVSRILQDRLVLDHEPVELRGLVHEVAARLAPEASRAGCPVLLRAEVEVAGRWDRRRLDQVLCHLLSNALKYGPNKPVVIALDAAPGSARLSVADHGIGIAPEQQARIFERFERAVPARHYGGFGLGLWTVRAIVEALGGQITVTSVAGEGSTFTVELPVAPAGAEES
jgi:signal transduction histidine kinase